VTNITAHIHHFKGTIMGDEESNYLAYLAIILVFFVLLNHAINFVSQFFIFVFGLLSLILPLLFIGHVGSGGLSDAFMMNQLGWSKWFLMVGVITFAIEFFVPYSGFSLPHFEFSEELRAFAFEVSNRLMYGFAILVLVSLIVGAFLVVIWKE